MVFKNLSGFTLVELTLVIVLLGILGAIALPRVSNLKSQARTQLILSGRAAIIGAASMVNMKVQASGTPTDGTLRTVDIGNGDLVEVVNGYPACTANGIPKATNLRKGYRWYVSGGSYCTLYIDAGLDTNGSSIYTAGCAVVYSVPSGGTWTPETQNC